MLTEEYGIIEELQEKGSVTIAALLSALDPLQLWYGFSYTELEEIVNYASFLFSCHLSIDESNNTVYVTAFN